MESIRRRILTQTRPERPLPEPAKSTKRYRVSGNLKSARKITGFRALYFHYCYLLRVFPKNRPQQNKRLHFLLREDLIQMEAISQETRLLARNRIDTAEQLVSYQSELAGRIEMLTDQRKGLYRARRTVAVKADEARCGEVSAQITAISKELSQLRREVKLCDDIAMRSGVIREKIQAVREDAQSERKENRDRTKQRQIGR